MEDITPTQSKEMNVVDVEIDMLIDDPEFNCRGKISPIDVHDLTEDIRVRGLLQPVVAAHADDVTKGRFGRPYMLIAGFRRLAAVKILGWTTIPCNLKPEVIPRQQALIINLNENIKRKDLNILQEAKAVSQLLLLGLGEFEVAKKIGKSRGWVQIRGMLLQMPNEIQQDASAGFITQNNIRQLYTMLRRGEDVFEATRQMKEASLRKFTLKANKGRRQGDPSIKKPQTRNTIFNMMEHIQNCIGNDLTTRALAWAAGEIDSGEFLLDLREETENRGRVYIPPQKDKIA